MKTLLASALILSAAVSAMADHTAFVPKPDAAPSVTETKKSKRAPSQYPPYTRNAAKIPAANSKRTPSSHSPSLYPAYTRNNAHSQPTSATTQTSVAGATERKRTDVSDK